MRRHRTRNRPTFISAIFIITFLLSSCATATPVIPEEFPDLEPEPQSQLDIPGGLLLLPDGAGADHPVLVFDFQIQSRLVTHDEYQECVEAGACEPAPEAIHDYAPAGVTWYQAQAYCSYLGGRLPTEAELTRSTGGSEDCQDSGGNLVSQEGFGEWVFDWDDPDFYNGSLVGNPFGPTYGDLKIAMGLNLDSINEVIYKYFGKYEDPESFAKYDGSEIARKGQEDNDTFAKWDDAVSFAKLDELKLTFAKYEGQILIKFEEGKFFIGTDGADQGKWESGEGTFYPRMGILPDQSNPLVGFRCVTQGAALSYAPICKTQTAAKCSLPAEQMETISAQLTMDRDVNPNFQIVGANCPQGDTFDITISHELSNGEGVEIKAGGKECDCQEYAEYPGKLYCDCPSPGAGWKTEIDVCAAGGETLIAMDDLCPSGSHFDIQSFMCVIDQFEPPALFSLVGDGGGSGTSACPSGLGLPVPQYGPLSLAAASVEGVGESELPEGDQWELFSLSDGSGMCPPGYAYSEETGCCSPYSDENYNCGPDEYFDAGLKRCLPVGWDGCGPCSDLGPSGQCETAMNRDMVGERCNVGNEEPVVWDEPGRSPESSSGCDSDAYLDPNLGMCVETDDGCALGYFLDPKTGRCRPISGPKSPCTEGYVYSSLTRCCQPLPGVESSELPIGFEIIDDAFPSIAAFAESGGCPTSHFYDEGSDSCRLRVGGECPSGTVKSLIGKCIPDDPGVCPEDFAYDPETDSCYSSDAGMPVCDGGKIFDPALGFCGPTPPTGPAEGMEGGKCDLQDLAEVEMVDGDSTDIDISCYEPGIERIPIFDFPSSTEGILRCLMLTADKTFRSGQGFCRSQGNEDGASEDFFTIDIEEGKVASIVRVSPDVIEPAEAGEPPEEDVGTCNIGYVFGAAVDTGSEPKEDDWSDPDSGGLPGGDDCTPSLFIDAGSLLAPGNCTTFSTTVPICATPVPSSGGSNKCTGLDYGKCGNTAGCGWNSGAAKCVVCSALTKVDCNNAGGCTYDGGTCKPN